MSKKKPLNTNAVLNELSGQSVFFQKENAPKKPRTMDDAILGSDPSTNHDTMRPINHDAMTPRDHDTTVSRYHDTSIETVRKAVKVIGKEAATHRFTSDEKLAIADLEYTYKRQGVRTSENQIARIAINFILQDHQENGENSLINRVLRALNE